jgi:hypothetical protein
MSQLRAMCRKFRAAFAVSAICALIFGLLVTGAAMPAHASINASTGDGIACDHASYVAGVQAIATQKDGAPMRGGSLAHACPDCCLAAHAGAAVLPERIATVTRPAAERPVTIHYCSGSARQPESLAWNAANGARAPPAILIV